MWHFIYLIQFWFLYCADYISIFILFHLLLLYVILLYPYILPSPPVHPTQFPFIHQLSHILQSRPPSVPAWPRNRHIPDLDLSLVQNSHSNGSRSSAWSPTEVSDWLSDSIPSGSGNAEINLLNFHLCSDWDTLTDHPETYVRCIFIHAFIYSASLLSKPCYRLTRDLEVCQHKTLKRCLLTWLDPEW